MVARYVAGGLLIASACHSSPSIPFADFAAGKLAAECDRLVRCGAFESADACVAYFHPLVPDASLAAAIDANKIRYDGQAAHACVAALAALVCDATSRAVRVGPSACADVFVGELAAGSSCDFDRECASDKCMQPAGCDPSGCCVGSCVDVTPAALGAACQVASDCVANAFCGSDLLCHALGKAEDTCFGDSQCDYGLGCITATLPGVCRALGSDNGACPDARCTDVGYVCPAGMCVPAGLVGAVCASSADCSSFETCDTTGLCAHLPDIGMTCTGRCEGDAYCDLMSGACAALLANTSACDTDNQCVSAFCRAGVIFDACADRPVCD